MKKIICIVLFIVVLISFYQFLYLAFPFLPRILPETIYFNNCGQWLALYCWKSGYYNYCFMARNPIILTAGYWIKDNELKKVKPGIYYCEVFDPEKATKTYIYINNKLTKKFHPMADEDAPSEIWKVIFRDNISGFIIIYSNYFKRIGYGIALLDYYGKNFKVIYKAKDDDDFCLNEEENIISEGIKLLIKTKKGEIVKILIPEKFLRKKEGIITPRGNIIIQKGRIKIIKKTNEEKKEEVPSKEVMPPTEEEKKDEDKQEEQKK